MTNVCPKFYRIYHNYINVLILQIVIFHISFDEQTLFNMLHTVFELMNREKSFISLWNLLIMNLVYEWMRLMLSSCVL